MTSLDDKGKFEVPAEFCELIARALEKQDMSMRQAAARASISPAFLSRILAGERGLPDDATLLRLGEALDIHPPEQVLVAAGRLPKGMKDLAALYLRATGPLNRQESREVMRAVEGLILKFEKKKKGA